MNWRRIVLLAAVFSIAIAVSIAGTRDRSRGTSAVATEADAMPLDYADRSLRDALDEYAMFALGRGLDPIAPACAPGSAETYRLVALPGMEPPESGFRAIDVVAGGSVARIEQRVFDRVRGNPDDAAWQVAYRRELDRGELDTLRELASRWLLSGKAASPGPHPIDASEWYLEICRRGRYHFAARYGAKRDAEANAEFLAFAEAMMGLRSDAGGGH